MYSTFCKHGKNKYSKQRHFLSELHRQEFTVMIEPYIERKFIGFFLVHVVGLMFKEAVYQVY